MKLPLRQPLGRKGGTSRLPWGGGREKKERERSPSSCPHLGRRQGGARLPPQVNPPLPEAPAHLSLCRRCPRPACPPRCSGRSSPARAHVSVYPPPPPSCAESRVCAQASERGWRYVSRLPPPPPARPKATRHQGRSRSGKQTLFKRPTASKPARAACFAFQTLPPLRFVGKASVLRLFSRDSPSGQDQVSPVSCTARLRTWRRTCTCIPTCSVPAAKDLQLGRVQHWINLR